MIAPGPRSQPSVRIGDSMPPRPDSTGLEERLAYVEEVQRLLWKRGDVHAADLGTILQRVTEVEESLGEEGNAKGKSSTGLHFAVEKGFAEQRAEMAAQTKTFDAKIDAVAKLVGDIAASMAAERAQRAEEKRIEDAKAAALAKHREPWAGSWTTARNAAIGTLVGGILVALGALLSRHLH